MSEQGAGAVARLRRAEANARILAGELARRSANPQPVAGVTPAPGGRDQSTVERRRIAVVCWDLGHNPAARAMAMADLLRSGAKVDLIGPQWSRYADELWAPLRDRHPPPISFRADHLTDFLASATGVATHRQGYDLVIICKPRLPGLILGALLQRANQCPVVLDIDEDELSFVDRDEPLFDIGARELGELGDPTDAAGTAIGVGLSELAPIRTVSNIALQNRFGGAIVRHARDERRFVRTKRRRAEGRAKLDADPDDFVLVFAGTPRPHKGLQVVIDALRLLDDHFVLHVVGARSPERFAREFDCTGARVVTHPLVPYTDVPTWIAGSDAIVLMQDLSNPIASFQIPAKIAEGLAMGIPVIATDAPPIADLPSRIVRRAYDADDLARQLVELRDSDDERSRIERRALFVSEFSNAVNRARLELVAEQAGNLAAATYRELTDSVLNVAFDAYTSHRKQPTRTSVTARGGVDIVMFWKQNDTGLYGRRADMLARYFARDPRVGRVLHLDAPIHTNRVFRDARFDGPSTDHTPWLSRSLLDRRLGLADDDNLYHRTMIYSDDGTPRRDPISGTELPTRSGFADYVAAQTASLGIDPSTSIAWVCPVVPDFIDVHRALRFRTVACDVIDDQRRFGRPVEDLDRIDEHYRRLLDLSDHVFTNCRPNAETFGSNGRTIHIVENGAETAAFDATHVPRSDATPVVAYVGNMRQRIDWPLIDSIARARPGYRFEMVGSVPESSDGHDVARHAPNLSLPGVVPYDDLASYLQSVDVCVVPHVQDRLTRTMNPLKMYNFYAAGVPIVSTPIANIGDLASSVVFARTAGEFAEAIDRGIEQRRSGAVERDAALLESIDWRTRATMMLDIVFGESDPASPPHE